LKRLADELVALTPEEHSTSSRRDAEHACRDTFPEMIGALYEGLQTTGANMIAVRHLALPLIFLLPACAAIQAAPGAERIKLTNQEPQGCVSLGEVVGTQGNAVSGAYTSNETLIVGARNDIKNKALALGANVVMLLPSTTGQTGGSTTSSHLLGVAYNCPSPIPSP
jgi:hypothetical protein